MCGHTHYNENYINSASNNSIHEHIHAAACGAWWFSDINGDGAPNGYGIHYFNGDNLVNSYYKPTHGVKEHQIRLHRGGDTAGGPYETFQYNINTSKNFTENTVLANIWNASSKWDVRVIEGDNDPVKMTLMSTVNDSWSIGYHIGVVGRGYIGGTRANYLTSCKHLYYYEPKNSSSSIKVIATDEFGNVYEQSTFTASRDYTEAKAP